MNNVIKSIYIYIAFDTPAKPSYLGYEKLNISKKSQYTVYFMGSKKSTH